MGSDSLARWLEKLVVLRRYARASVSYTGSSMTKKIPVCDKMHHDRATGRA